MSNNISLIAQPQPITTKRDSGAGAVAVTPDDSVQLTRTRALYVGTSGGDLTVVHPINPDGSPNVLLTPITYANAPVGYHPLQVILVMDTGTDVSDIVAIY